MNSIDNSFSTKKVSVPLFKAKKQRTEIISMLTAYDFPTAQWIDQSGVDSILVGDSLGMVVLGYDNTLPVTMDEMIHHCKAVFRGAKRALLIGDMPFMSYQVSVEEAVRNAGRFLQEGGMDAVKLEGGRERLSTIEAISLSGIPVMGHLGLTPQSVHMFGGFKPQATSLDSAIKLVRDAHLLQDAGCFGIVLESVPSQLAEYVSDNIDIPTIGIGAGVGCDGQVLVTHDLLGIFDKFKPRFVKRYADFKLIGTEAIKEYIKDISDRSFPSDEHSINLDEEAWISILEKIESDAI